MTVQDCLTALAYERFPLKVNMTATRFRVHAHDSRLAIEVLASDPSPEATVVREGYEKLEKFQTEMAAWLESRGREVHVVKT